VKFPTLSSMSSYSEYLGRMKQRLPNIQDTRPHRDAGHQTEIVRRLAASGNLETAVASTACARVLNAPSTRGTSQFLHGGGHNVQDMSSYVAYKAGQAVAQGFMPANAKTSQISNVCYSTAVVPEINDKIAASTDLQAIQAQKNAYQRGYGTANCPSCGGIYTPTKVQFASGCNCKLTVNQAAGFKSAGAPLHTIEPNVNVA